MVWFRVVQFVVKHALRQIADKLIYFWHRLNDLAFARETAICESPKASMFSVV